MELDQNTPNLSVIDPRGLRIRTVVFHRKDAETSPSARVHHQVFDRAAHLIEQWDPRLFKQHALGADVRANQMNTYSLSGRVLATDNVDAGWLVTLSGEADQSLAFWDSRGTSRRTQYDQRLRPVARFERGESETVERCSTRMTYAEALFENSKHNRCGRIIREDDPAGSLAFDDFNLLGTVLRETRRFRVSMDVPDWPQQQVERDKLLETELFSTSRRHTVQGEVIEQKDARNNRQRFSYGVAGQVNRVCVQPYSGINTDTTENVLVESLIYNAQGQVELQRGGNGVTNTALYSPSDGTLEHLKTGSGTRVFQDLRYVYDPVGNILSVEDQLPPVHYFNQQKVEAISTYIYDTLYQVIQSSGRESVRSQIGPGMPPLEFFGLVDDTRWRNYVQHYAYDEGGNLTKIKHQYGQNQSCTRHMTVAQNSNRSLLNDDPDGPPAEIANGFDKNGNQRELMRGQEMSWDLHNQLYRVTQVVRANGESDDEAYIYDAHGQRVRKVCRRRTASGTHTDQTRYLPGLEICEKSASGEIFNVVALQSKQSTIRLLQWELGKPRTMPSVQVRYGITDHLGSNSIELNEDGQLLSHECFYAFGGTAWWAARNATDANYKVIRYSGKERDVTGLYYYGYRYYATWLQRWLSPDPAGDVDGLNLFHMVQNNPLRYRDISGLSPFKKNLSSPPLKGDVAGAEMGFGYSNQYRGKAPFDESGDSIFDRENRRSANDSRNALMSSWNTRHSEGFTSIDTAKVPNQFRFMVHTVPLEDMQKAKTSGDTYYTELFSNPESILGQRDVLSMSVVSDQHSYTYAGTGFVIKVPPQNILVTSPVDMDFRNRAGEGRDQSAGASGVLSRELIKSRSKYQEILTPMQLVSKSREDRNEVLVVGRHGVNIYPGMPATEKLEVVGVFTNSGFIDRTTGLEAKYSEDDKAFMKGMTNLTKGAAYFKMKGVSNVR
jgi:insecticidal toxin complex protein TccC